MAQAARLNSTRFRGPTATKLKIYKGGSHGIGTTEIDKVNSDRPEFIKA
jgi:hypothetical protein